jgi:penicillin G amidase
MTRLIVQGRLAEFFGSRVIVLDKFMRNMGFYRLAQGSVGSLSEEEESVLKAYCDGINDFVAEVSLTGENSSASLYPPEIYIFGMTDEVRKPWTIADVLGYGRLISF